MLTAAQLDLCHYSFVKTFYAKRINQIYRAHQGWMQKHKCDKIVRYYITEADDQQFFLHWSHQKHKDFKANKWYTRPSKHAVNARHTGVN